MDNLATEADHLYETFARYPLKPRIDGCPHCELEAAESALHRTTLRDLGWEELGVYPFKAMTTFGDLDDYKHFLPRILELYAIDGGAARYDVSVLLGKLQYAEWESWPAAERVAVRAFLRAWRDLLRSRAEVPEFPEYGETSELEDLERALGDHGIDLEEV